MYDLKTSSEFERAKNFIRDLFLAKFRERGIFTYFTNALDTESVQDVFEKCQEPIERMVMRRYELI